MSYSIGPLELIYLASLETDLMDVFSKRSCSWCDTLNDVRDEYCRNCGHCAHVPRVCCYCPQCKPVVERQAA